MGLQGDDVDGVVAPRLVQNVAVPLNGGRDFPSLVNETDLVEVGQRV